ncbi:MAG: transketolase, partial [Pseudomonadota bacterium]
IYALLHLSGYARPTMEEIANFRQLGSPCAGHPENFLLEGVECTTGPLGQGLAMAVGMAIAERHLNAQFGSDLVDHRTWVIAGDGCLMEGISQEAISLAGHLKLKKLILLWDDNNITIDGAVSMADSTDQLARFQASGWNTLSCDGHDQEAVDAAITQAKSSDKPTLIACKTTIGKGANEKAGTAGVHGAPLGEEELNFARNSLNWPHPPFEVPAEILNAWREAGTKSARDHQAWQARLEKSADAQSFQDALGGGVEPAEKALHAYAQELLKEPKAVATRKASQNALEVINEALPTTLGGSADLTGSNNTKTGALDILSAENYGGRYLHYGIREHGMAAAMNGLALHGGVIPYGGTFMVFTDYARPSMRLSALMGQRVIYVMTHDSIGLGEDGPTHQPVEHVASLRAIPNMVVFRPADAVETAEAWAAALARTDGPSVLSLTRQNLELVREEASSNKVAQGGYVLREADNVQATFIATGSEIGIAVEAAEILAKENITVRIVSMPAVELFEKQSEDYQKSVLGTAPRLAIEAGVRQGWDRLLYAFGGQGEFLGLSDFGASGPYKQVYAHFGLTAENAAEKIRKLIKE